MTESEPEVGTVYLVGAGPGDPDLITIKGARLLEKCDAVVYDNLVPDELIVTLPPSVERHYVGKKAARHSLPQDEINQLLVELASRGKDVVRLKGGDPFTFGRGGEEAGYLAKHSVPFEIVPGITAGIAAPAYAGIPCTDRQVASSVTFLTGHKAADKNETDISWKWLAKSENNTLVIYMGVAELQQNVKRLLDSGMSPDTPAAAIERGTFPTQRTVATTLADLPGKTRQANLKPPVLFVIGKVVDLRESLNWFRVRPLSSLRVLVTRPADQAEWVYRKLRELGAEVLPYPTIATEEEHDRAAWKQVQAINTKKRWLVFTSENGVRYFMNQWREQFQDLRPLAAYKIAAVGFGTARALKAHSIRADFVPSRATTAELARRMAADLDLQNSTVIRVRGNLADDRVEHALEQAGAAVLPLSVYRTFTPAWTDELKEKLSAYPPDVIFFTSGSTANGFATNLTEAEIKQMTASALVMSIGPSTSEVIQSHGITVGLEAKVHSIPSMIDELVAHLQVNPIRRPI